MIFSIPYSFSFRNRYVKWLFISVLGVCMVWLYLFDPQVAPSTPPCLFHLFTWLDCPGCGTARACHQLLHGRLLEAMDYNLLFVFVIPFLMAKTYSYLSGVSVAGIERIYRPKLLLWIVLLFWILRNIDMPLFTYLASNH